MTKLANTDNSHYSGGFTSSNVSSCGLKGGRRRKTFRKKSMKKRRNMKKTKSFRKKSMKKSIKRRRRRSRKLKGGSYTTVHDDSIKMGPKGGVGTLSQSNMNPTTDLIETNNEIVNGDLSNLHGQAGGKRRQSRKARKSRKMRGGNGPVQFGYGIDSDGLKGGLALANPAPIKSYNSCQADNYVH